MEGESLCCGACGATYGFAGSAPDFLGENGEVGGVETDWDYHAPERPPGRLRSIYRDGRRALELKLVAREAERAGRPLDILDLGCGDPGRTGSYHARLQPFSRLYLGVEPSHSIVSRLGPCRLGPQAAGGVVRASGELPVVRDAVVDLAVSFSSLDHCVEPPRVLANLARALRPGGAALIDLRNPAAWYKRSFERMPGWPARLWQRSHDPHNWRFTPADLARALAAAGFEEIEIHDVFYLEAVLPRRGLDWLPRLLGEGACAGACRLADRLGRRLAPRRGGNFIAMARKPRP
jgi:SAM-dependent methyltransferase